MVLLTFLGLFWFVSFTDKGNDAYLALGERAVEQRAKWSIDIDSLDYSVSPTYLNELRRTGARIRHTSRWMNGATIEADSTTIEQIAQFPYVKTIEQTRNNVCNNPNSVSQRKKKVEKTTAIVNYNQAQQQLDVFNLTPLHQLGYKGQGIHLAVIDGGFQNIDTLGCFNYIRPRLSLFDMADSEYDFYGEENAHGSFCMSLIGGYQPLYTQTIKDTTYQIYYEGAAVDATFYAIQAEEVGRESPKECDNLLAAIELCDSLGVNVVSVSLGYFEFDDTTFNYTYGDMDGKTIRVSRGYTIAARKGMLCVNAAGNEGINPWHYITAPSDADSILTVGAVNIQRDIASFSSHGPSYDGRVKPDVCAVGWLSTVINPANNQLQQGNGTSFACPLMAGLAATLWSALPNENAMQIRERIIRSANQYTNPDDDYGFGIPDAMTAYHMSLDSDLNILTNAIHERCVYIENGQIIIVVDGIRYSVLGARL